LQEREEEKEETNQEIQTTVRQQLIQQRRRQPERQLKQARVGIKLQLQHSEPPAEKEKASQETQEEEDRQGQ